LEAKTGKGPASAGWQELFRIGDEIAAADAPALPTLTETIIPMRSQRLPL
jgi:hypothetical protein